MTEHRRLTMERRPENEDLQDAKKLRHFEEEAVRKEMPYGELLSRLSDLMLKISNFMMVKESEIHGELRKLNDSIPTIVFWGNQSSGKSSCIQSMFPSENFARKTGAGLATSCPIELLFGSNYENKIYVEFPDGKKKVFKTVLEAEDFVSTNVKKSMDLANVTIKYECECKTTSVHIIDLPGCKVDSQEYFEYLRDRYLYKKNALVFHVVRGDVDAGTDNSYNYLRGIDPTRIVRIVTNIDAWVTDVSKYGYLENHIMYKDCLAGKVALVSNHENAEKALDTFKERYSKYSPVCGSKELLDYVVSSQKEMIKGLLPEIRKHISIIKAVIENEMNVCGRIPQDMKDVCFSYRTTTSRHLKSFKKSNEAYNKDFNANRRSFIEYNYEKFFGEFPSVASLASEIKEKEGVEVIPGLGGCDSIVKDHLVGMYGKLFDSCRCFAEVIFHLIENFVQAGMSTDNPFATKVSAEITHKTLEYLMSEKEEVISCIKKNIETFKQNPPRLQGREISLGFVGKDIYHVNAEYAREMGLRVWLETSRNIVTTSASLISSYEKKTIEKLKELVMECKDTDFSESEDITKRRITLGDIEKACDGLDGVTPL